MSMPQARRATLIAHGALLLLAAAPPLVPLALHAQDTTGRPAMPPRRAPLIAKRTTLLHMVLGAAAGGVLAYGYYAVSEKGSRGGACAPKSCAAPYLMSAGAVSGLFIGREAAAQRRALAPRVGANLKFENVPFATLGDPTSLAVRDALVAVVSDSGAQLLDNDRKPVALRRRASGLSNMRVVDFAGRSDSLLIGTANALWVVGAREGPASRVADGGVTALASSPMATLFGNGRILRRRGAAGDSLVMSDIVNTLAFDVTSGAFLAGGDSGLYIVRTDGSLREERRIVSPAPIRAIASNATWVAAAAGEGGVLLWRRDQLFSRTGGITEPIRFNGEPRYAFDVAFTSTGLFIAGGVDGLYRVALDGSPRILGASREFQYATSVRAKGDTLWVGDRSKSAVVRVQP